MGSTTVSSVADDFREVMAAVCTPVSVVTAMDGSRPHGTTVSAFASLSMNPPMVMVALDRTSQLLTLVGETSRFGLNVLGSMQTDLAMRFAGKGEAKFGGVSWSASSGVPRLSGAPGWLACTVDRLIDGGDHAIALGLIIEADSRAVAPLTYHSRRFGTHSTAEGDR